MLAKSDGLTLKEHTNDLLRVAKNLKVALPTLEELFEDKDFWKFLEIAIIFHDIGKATIGFQELMTKGEPYRFRHEIISAIVAKNFTDNELIINAILAHHKNFKKLKELLKEYENNKKYNQDRWIEKEFKELDLKFVEDFLSEYNIEVKNFILQAIEENIKKWTSKRVKRKVSELEKFQNIFLSASLSICDHNASAGIEKIPIIQNKNFSFLDNTPYKPYTHQKLSWQSGGNVLLIAPTGQGKTESSLGWLRNQLKNRQARAFYILPFTASINAMTKRVASKEKGFGDSNLVGLLHGKAKFFIDEFYEKQDGLSLKDLIDINKKIVKPFKVVTPFQILKWAFGVKGFEKGLTELAGSYLIFDEIHIYDKELFRRVLFFIEWLIEKLRVKVFIMTATMPTFMQEHIKSLLNIKQEIRADKKRLNEIKRHKVKLLNSSINEQIDFIQENLNNGKSVLVVCNSVAKAQELYETIESKNKVLLHSGFNGRDRTIKEKLIQAKNKPQLLVGTQAIEVSLDIDYDLIITEPAPLDALLQRFGRVYRGQNRVLQEEDRANCFVTTEIEKVHKLIYDEAVIQNSLKALEKIEGKILHEDTIQELLDEVYEPFELDNDNLRANFRNLLDNLYPYNIYEESEEEFFKQFDGVEVLPYELQDQFIEFIENREFLEAEKLFVSISKRKFASNNIEFFEPNNYGKTIPIIYLEYSSELGLLNKKEDNSNFQGFL